MKPLAIDLYCGGLEPELFARANAVVKELVASGAQNPDHMSLAVLHHASRPLSLKSRAMRNFDYSPLATCFALSRQIRIFSLKTLNAAILIRSPRVVDLLDAWLTLVEGSPLRTRSLSSAILRAVSLICVGRRYREMRPALAAISTGFRHVCLFAAASSSCATCAWWRAIDFVGANGLKGSPAIGAKQIIHVAIMP